MLSGQYLDSNEHANLQRRNITRPNNERLLFRFWQLWTGDDSNEGDNAQLWTKFTTIVGSNRFPYFAWATAPRLWTGPGSRIPFSSIQMPFLRLVQGLASTSVKESRSDYRFIDHENDLMTMIFNVFVHLWPQWVLVESLGVRYCLIHVVPQIGGSWSVAISLPFLLDSLFLEVRDALFRVDELDLPHPRLYAVVCDISLL